MNMQSEEMTAPTLEGNLRIANGEPHLIPRLRSGQKFDLQYVIYDLLLVTCEVFESRGFTLL